MDASSFAEDVRNIITRAIAALIFSSMVFAGNAVLAVLLTPWVAH
jgi:hypothetical protein